MRGLYYSFMDIYDHQNIIFYSTKAEIINDYKCMRIFKTRLETFYYLRQQLI